MEKCIMKNNNWFNVDKDGLSKILERRSKAFIIYELLQNAWDQNVSVVDVIFEPVEGKRCFKLTVTDDDPEGFHDLTHTFTLFAESNKKKDSSKRGRFNLGEKLVLACCQEAQVLTTSGGIKFTHAGERKTLRQKRKKGSEFSAIVKMTKKEFQEVCDSIHALIPPDHIKTTFNGEELIVRKPMVSFQEPLTTEVGDDEGYLKKTTRKTTINVFQVGKGEVSHIYEMGIPIVETDISYHVDIQQKVPMNMDRDNVTPAYLQKVETLVLNNTYEYLDEDTANATWVKEAVSDENCDDAAVTKTLDLRFGKNRVFYDPSDPEANNRAVSNGCAVIKRSQQSKKERKNTIRGGTTKPAGKVFPTPHPKTSPNGIPPIDEKDLTENQKKVIGFAKVLAKKIMGIDIDVDIYKINDNYRASYGEKTLDFNLSRLGRKFFDEFPDNIVTVIDLLIHEFGHEYCGDHLSDEYYLALTNLGAKFTKLALDEPALFTNENH